MSPSPRAEEAKAATRRRILDAAVDVFSRLGYHQAAVDEIVRESGTSKGAIYFHFPSKESIFFAVVEEFAGLLERRIDQAIGERRGAVHRVTAAVEVALETLSRHRKLAKIFLVDAVGLGPPFAQRVLAVHERFTGLVQRYLDQAVAEGDLEPQDTALAATVWFGALNELLLRWVLDEKAGPEVLQAQIPALTTLLLRSVGR
ncbi:TetR/AcrR family transcriptional regulator [Limnochorda pilosa]|uniref:TetR family transcriptional regulator n=1 Tax=Limnochorda pilosa TaxID=1555112 RepID=A0A0K2SNQ8_LIMPI|nr:TetR/AcrR family transcriptional regulator [Limnochorda pilosa]BAS28768.1 TetR family transcriptional regulator [Limnochorda pilosa]